MRFGDPASGAWWAVSESDVALEAAVALARGQAAQLPSDVRATVVYQNADGSIRDISVGTPGGPVAVVRIEGEDVPALPEEPQEK